MNKSEPEQRSQPDSRSTSTRWSLIQRLRNWDDAEGWQEFFETYWRLIYGTAIKSGLTDVEAQDVVQETVISVSRNIRQFNPSPEAGSFKAWLLRMTRWRIIDQVRKRPPRRPGVDRPGDRQVKDSETSTTGLIPDPVGLELERVWDEEWRGNLTNAALARVQGQTSARHYQIFYLYAIRGAPVQQVAAATGVSADEIYMVKHRLLPLFEKAVRTIERRQP
jgi:RNA polymerase sigma-70 factor (ECF subfamily)